MIFSSLPFIIFFIIFFLLIKLFRNNQKNIIILLSLFFYAYWNPIFIILIFYLSFVTFICYKKKLSLLISSFFVLAPLIYFKYSYFILLNLKLSNNLDLAYNSDLPLAISFVTFTALAFLIDVRRKVFIDNINFFSFLEFIVYFPQLIAGPILRANELIPQLKKKIIFNSENIKLGLILFTLGFVKKVYFADSIALIIDPIFLNPNEAPVSDLIKGFLLFPFQIYFDFSGYIDMALGISNIFSITLPINFNKPYLSRSITEFWRNWHITLSNWFKDYIYIPIGGSKNGDLYLFVNLIFTMSLAGLWHGANFNFIIWGFLNGLLLFLEKKITYLKSLNDLTKIFINCFIIFNLWLVFRIQNLDTLNDYFVLLYANLDRVFDFNNLLVLMFVIIFIVSQKFDNFSFIEEISKKIKLKYFLPIAIILIISGLSFVSGGSEKFIYFNF